MKIIQISSMTNLNNYGAQRTHTLGIAKNLAFLGHKVHLIVGEKGDTPKIDNLEISVPEFTNPILLKRYFPIFIKTIKNNFKQYSFLRNLKNYDIIYERFLAFSFSSLFFSKIKRIPLVYEVNGISDEELFGVFNIKSNVLKKIIHTIIRFQLKNSKKIIVQTKELKKIMEKRFNISNIHVVPNGTDLFDLQEDKINPTFKICYVGEIDDLHNLHQVFEALSSLNKKFIFYVIGGGTLLEEYNLKYNKDKRFVFKGKLPHKEAIKLIKECNLCIASNSKDYPAFKKYGFYLCPLKLLEYSMAGKPTILFESYNSFTKIFEENNACFITNTKKDFIEKILLLLNKPELVKKMGKNARELVESRFTWIESAKKTETIFKKIIKGQKKK